MAFPVVVSSDAPVPEDAVMAYCHNPDRLTLFQEVGCSARVARLNSEHVVKFGYGVYREEFETQQFIFDRADHSKVRIARPVYYFRRKYKRKGLASGYFIMQWMEDFKPVGLEDITAVAQAILHMQSISRGVFSKPGPLGRGQRQGRGVCREIFEDDFHFKDKSDLERFLNHRKRNPDHVRFSLVEETLVLTHLDLAPRNIGRLNDGSICFLDWAFAGFYPRWFENAMLQARDDPVASNQEFRRQLLQALDDAAPLTEAEHQQRRSLISIPYNCIAFSFSDHNAPPRKSKPKRRKKKSGQLPHLPGKTLMTGTPAEFPSDFPPPLVSSVLFKDPQLAPLFTLDDHSQPFHEQPRGS